MPARRSSRPGTVTQALCALPDRLPTKLSAADTGPGIAAAAPMPAVSRWLPAGGQVTGQAMPAAMSRWCRPTCNAWTATMSSIRIITAPSPSRLRFPGLTTTRTPAPGCGAAAAAPSALSPWTNGNASLCATGFASGAANANDTWTWNCISEDQTNTVACTTPQTVNAGCGSDNNSTPSLTAPWTAIPATFAQAALPVVRRREMVTGPGYAPAMAAALRFPASNRKSPMAHVVLIMEPARRQPVPGAIRQAIYVLLALPASKRSPAVTGNGTVRCQRGSTASCKQSEIITGNCGSDNGGNSVSAPWISDAADLCTSGTAASETESGGQWHLEM